jgi:hypothetical protein
MKNYMIPYEKIGLVNKNRNSLINMTVKELKKALRGVPDDVEVTALKDGYVCERVDVWGACYDEEEDEDGKIVTRFTINC